MSKPQRKTIDCSSLETMRRAQGMVGVGKFPGLAAAAIGMVNGRQATGTDHVLWAAEQRRSYRSGT